MRIVVVGGGTAGHMAVAHITKHLPDAELLHIYDSSRPSIGVGEGTTPDFVRWLNSIGVGVNELEEHCQATPKRGLTFEQWGASNERFDHEFLPRSEQAVHFSAKRLPDLLASRSECQRLDTAVEEVLFPNQGVVLLTEYGESIDADLMIDARGFQSAEQSPSHHFDWIPTNAALVTKVPRALAQATTRAIARPLGWIFCIPLADETSFGYLYDSRLSTPGDVSEDFDAFLRDDQRWHDAKYRSLAFPNFARRDVFDGRVLHIGNCASFVEPLEATAIGVIVLQLHLLQHWCEWLEQGMSFDEAVNRVNRIHEDTLVKISVFISWHYAAGSAHSTPFWDGAAESFHRLSRMAETQRLFKEFDSMHQRSLALKLDDLAGLNTAEDMASVCGQGVRPQFGGYGELSFAQLANGLGLNSVGCG